jgi:hypothetical protein
VPALLHLAPLGEDIFVHPIAFDLNQYPSLDDERSLPLKIDFRSLHTGLAGTTAAHSRSQLQEDQYLEPVFKWAHNLKVVGSNPTPATKFNRAPSRGPMRLVKWGSGVKLHGNNLELPMFEHFVGLCKQSGWNGKPERFGRPKAACERRIK